MQENSFKGILTAKKQDRWKNSLILFWFYSSTYCLSKHVKHWCLCLLVQVHYSVKSLSGYFCIICFKKKKGSRITGYNHTHFRISTAFTWKYRYCSCLHAIEEYNVDIFTSHCTVCCRGIKEAYFLCSSLSLRGVLPRYLKQLQSIFLEQQWIKQLCKMLLILTDTSPDSAVIFNSAEHFNIVLVFLVFAFTRLIPSPVFSERALKPTVLLPSIIN